MTKKFPIMSSSSSDATEGDLAGTIADSSAGEDWIGVWGDWISGTLVEVLFASANGTLDWMTKVSVGGWARLFPGVRNRLLADLLVLDSDIVV